MSNDNLSESMPEHTFSYLRTSQLEQSQTSLPDDATTPQDHHIESPEFSSFSADGCLSTTTQTSRPTYSASNHNRQPDFFQAEEQSNLFFSDDTFLSRQSESRLPLLGTDKGDQSVVSHDIFRRYACDDSILIEGTQVGTQDVASGVPSRNVCGSLDMSRKVSVATTSLSPYSNSLRKSQSRQPSIGNKSAEGSIKKETASSVAPVGIAAYIIDPEADSSNASMSPTFESKPIKRNQRRRQPDAPWFCVSKPISEQTKNIKIRSINRSSAIHFGKVLEKCRSIVEFLTPMNGEEEINESNIQDMNHNHYWGDSLPMNTKGNAIRVVYQNVHRSLSASDNPHTNVLLDNLNKMDADVFMAAESNINWKAATFRNDFKQKVSRIWPANRLAFSSSDVGLEFEMHEFLPGGTCTMAVDTLSMRVVKAGEDPSGLGRWSYLTMEGQEGRRVTFITAYRICSGVMRGTSTACRQQSKVLEQQAMKQGKRTSAIDTNFLRKKFVEDLALFITSLQNDGHAIVLGLDANETPEESIKNNEVKQGSISWLLDQTGLQEVFNSQHSHLPDSTTTTPGRFIDRVAISGIPIQRVTLLRANEPAKSDHLGIVVDLDLKFLFNNACSPLVSPTPRKLTSGNIKSVQKYLAFVQKQFGVHKIVERCRRLRSACDDNEFTDDHKQQLFALDKQVTEILLGAENQCSKKRKPRTLWSPALKRAGQEISFWKQRISMNGTCDEGTKELGERLQLPGTILGPLPIQVCKFYLTIAWKSYNGIKKQAREQRLKFLKERAKEYAVRGNGDVEKAIKQIRNREQLKFNYASIRRGYGINKMGLTTLDVPDPVTGGRRLITESNEIHNYLLERNERHFSQATYTTFGDAGPGFYYIDPNQAESDTYIDEMLDGVFEPWDSSSPYVREFLKELQCTVKKEISTKLHLNDFISLFKSIPENTASSVSGLHYGHYRVLSKMEDTSIIQVLFDMVDIAFITHSPLPRWQHVTQLMLEKGKGPGIENLRVIQLLEADLNWLLRFLWGKRLDRHATEEGVYNESQFASPGKLCQSAILNKVVFFDLLRQNRHYGALIDNDATAAFDRVLPALCVVTCKQLGMPKHAQRFFFKMLRQTIYTTTTAHGRSTNTYSASSNSAAPGQGVMQGGGASLPNYKSQQLPVLKAIEKNGISAAFRHASKLQATFRRWASGFSDDISLFLNELGIQLACGDENLPMATRLKDAVQSNFERYEEYFFTSGGALNLKKCFYYLVGFIWTGTEWRYQSNQELGVDPISIKPTTLDGIADPQTVKWYEATEAQRTLGSHIAPDGSHSKQLEVLMGKLNDWQNCLSNINAANLQAKWLSYKNVFLKKILYPLIGHTFHQDDLVELQTPVDRHLLHILGLNEHFPRAVLYAPLKFGGLGCITIHGQHVVDKLLLFLHHMREKGQIHEALAASMSTTQIECGSSKPFFSLDAEIYHPLVTKTWISHLWYECNTVGIDIRFHPECFWTPKPVRERDLCIMEVATKLYSGIQLHQINMCRLALKVVLLSDIASVDGKRILLAYYHGRPHNESGRRSRLNWPPVGELPKQWWKVWQAFLERWCGTSLQIPEPLGRWYEDAEMITQCCCFLFERRLLMQHKGGLYEFLPVNATSRTRFLLQAYTVEDFSVLEQARVVDITYKSNSIYIVSQRGQDILRGPDVSKVTCLQDLYNNLSPELQRIIGHVEWPSPHALLDIVDSVIAGTMIGVSDGSVRTITDKATHAWIIQANNGSEICGSGPVDGPLEARTSHRAEIQGVAALFLFLSLIIKYYNITKGKFCTFCDNQAVIKKLQQRWRIWKYRHTKGPDGDLQALLRQLTEELRQDTEIQYESNWVQGHQDRENNPQSLPRPASLNIQMDTKAKEAYDLPPQWHTSTFVPVLKAEVCGIYLGDDKITSHLQRTLSERWHEKEAKIYMSQRHGINTDIFPLVNWTSLRYALQKLSVHRRATAVKALHRHLPSQEKLFKQGRVVLSSLCPRCLQAPETNSHVYCCMNDDAFAQRKRDWVELWKQLHRCTSANIIEQTWRYHLQPLLNIPLGNSVIEGLPIAHGEVADLLAVAVHEQSLIGWDKLLLGLVARTWKTIQEVIDSANPNAPKRTATAWINTATHHLIKFSLRCWKARNSMIHGATRIEQKRIALQNVRDKITAIYENPPALAPQFRSIHEIPLAHRLQMPLQAAEQWISMISHQVKVTHHNFQCLLREHKPMPTHLRTMRREARAQAKARNQPATPRKAHSRAVQAAVKEMRNKLYSRRRTKSTRQSRKPRSTLRRTVLSADQNGQQSLTQDRPTLRHHPP